MDSSDRQGRPRGTADDPSAFIPSTDISLTDISQVKK
jgi:hypothetical protein